MSITESPSPAAPATPPRRPGRPRTANRQKAATRAAPERTAEPRTAAEPRAAAPEIAASDDMPLRRRSRAERQEHRFSVPEHLKKPGWDYQYWPITVLGQPVDRASITDAFQGGWRPVPVSEMPEMMPPGDPTEFVEDGGQRLFKRPKAFTEEAKAEERALALEVTTKRITAASRGAADSNLDIKGVRTVPLGMAVEAEAGTYKGQKG